MAMGGTSREELLAAFWQAFSHPIRIRILEHLRDEGPLNVSQLVDRMGIGQGHLSNHLACLRSCGLADAVPAGRFVYYRIADERVTVLLDMGAQVLQDHLDGVAACPVVRPVAARENAVG